MSVTLKKACEIALAQQYAKVPGLRAITPKLWDADAPVRLPHLNIQAAPSGGEMVWRYGVYSVECTIRVEDKPRRQRAKPADYMGMIEYVHAELASLDKEGLAARFAGTGVYVHGVEPRQMPASLEGDNRVDMASVVLTAFLV